MQNSFENTQLKVWLSSHHIVSICDRNFCSKYSTYVNIAAIVTCHHSDMDQTPFTPELHCMPSGWSKHASPFDNCAAMTFAYIVHIEKEIQLLTWSVYITWCMLLSCPKCIHVKEFDVIYSKCCLHRQIALINATIYFFEGKLQQKYSFFIFIDIVVDSAATTVFIMMYVSSTCHAFSYQSS